MPVKKIGIHPNKGVVVLHECELTHGVLCDCCIAEHRATGDRLSRCGKHDYEA